MNAMEVMWIPTIWAAIVAVAILVLVLAFGGRIK